MYRCTNGLWKIFWMRRHSFSHAHVSDRAGRLSHLLNNALRGLLPQGNDKPCFSWYRGGLIIRCLCNHMETASHSSFIRPFIAVIAEWALFYELLNKFCRAHVHLKASRLQIFFKPVVRQSKCPPLAYLVSFIWGVGERTGAVVSCAGFG